uniref:Aminoacyl-transfer RNA synthetases class-II family profile domain-containing protein n=1 Tax=Bartheletia paradoxa TaxID=669517 RepID=A0A2D0XI50_9BASI|nr:hypothetical protein SPAR04327 [Bartheletia paradoxa]
MLPTLLSPLRASPSGPTRLRLPLIRLLSTPPTLPPSIRQTLATASPSPGSENQPPITVRGSIKSVRRQKRVAFAEIGDGSACAGLQAVMTPELAVGLTTGTTVSLSGKLVPSRGAGQKSELSVSNVSVLGACDASHAHLRSRTNGTSSMLRLRDSLARGVHDYFESEDFIHVQTPILTSSDCEGAGEVFRVRPDTPSASPGTPSAASSSSTTPSPPDEFFSRPVYLTVSSQLHLESLSAGLSRVYTLSPTFRAEPSQTSRHLAEFWMLEAEVQYAQGLEDIMSVAEGCIKSALGGMLGLSGQLTRAQERGADALAFFDGTQNASSTPPGELVPFLRTLVRPSTSWPRLTYTRAIQLVREHQTAHPEAFVYPVRRWGDALQAEHEKWLARDGPVFVTDYPASLKPFYMRMNDDGSRPAQAEALQGIVDDDDDVDVVDRRTVACFDLLVPRLGELAGGSLREERLAHLESALESHAMNQVDYAWYVDLRRYGTAPHGGFGLGWERLVGLVSGLENVRECIAFPRWKGSCMY